MWVVLVDIDDLVRQIFAIRRTVPRHRAVLAAITGIDASGKGHVAREAVGTLTQLGHRVAGISTDAWLNLPGIRFDATDPPRHFYRHAIRFAEMFRDVVLPLRDHRFVRAEVDVAEETMAHSAHREAVVVKSSETIGVGIL